MLGRMAVFFLARALIYHPLFLPTGRFGVANEVAWAPEN